MPSVCIFLVCSRKHTWPSMTVQAPGTLSWPRIQLWMASAGWARLTYGTELHRSQHAAAHILGSFFRARSTIFLRMWGKPNSCLLLAVRQVATPHWKQTHYTKNSTLKHTASNVAPNDESESSIGQPCLSLSSCKILYEPASHSALILNNMLFTEWRCCRTERLSLRQRYNVQHDDALIMNHQCQILFQSLDPLSNHIQHFYQQLL